MKIIIVGCGRVGRTIARQLEKEGHSITVIDTDGEALQAIAGTQNIMALEGNGATFSTLTDAGVADCDLLIAVTALDEDEEATSVVKKVREESDYFNTLSVNEKESSMIKAIVDEDIKAVDGSQHQRHVTIVKYGKDDRVGMVTDVLIGYGALLFQRTTG